jgi:hypothetical protein
VSEDIPEPIKGEFEEANICFSIGAYKACIAMCQRTQESICQNKGVSTLNELRDSGIISSGLFDRATEIRLWAGILKHKPIEESISSEDCEELLTYLEMILDSVFISPKRLERLQVKRKDIKSKQKEPC